MASIALYLILSFVTVLVIVMAVLVIRERRAWVHGGGNKQATMGVLGDGVFALLLFGIAAILPETRGTVWVICFLIWLISARMVHWFWSRRKGGLVLLDLGRSGKTKTHLLTFGILLGVGGGWFAMTSLEEPYTIIAVYGGLCILTFGLSHYEIRERGIFCDRGLVEWERIESFAWGEEAELILALQDPRLGFRLIFSQTTSLPIQPIHRQAVEHLLTENLPIGKGNT